MNAQDPNDKSKVVHVYDDIEEEDNRLPNWWLAILFGSIVFSAGYWFVYHSTKALPSPNEEYAADLQTRQALQAAQPKPSGDAAWAALAQNPAALEEGKKTFTQICAACHGPEGAGLVGPNLTDAFWIKGGSPEAIHQVISKGSVEKGMPAWEPILGAEKTQQVTAFVLSCKGKNLPGKEPQGTEEPAGTP